MKRTDLEIFIQNHLIQDGWKESEFGVISANIEGGSCNLTYVIADVIKAYVDSIKTDADVVLAQDADGKVIFMKTFNGSEREQMLKAYEYVSGLPNCSHRMCGIERLKIEV